MALKASAIEDFDVSFKLQEKHCIILYNLRDGQVMQQSVRPSREEVERGLRTITR